MNEKQFGYRIRQILNRGTTVDLSIAERLRSTRFQALDKQQLTAPSVVLVAVNGASGILGGPRSIGSRILLPLLILAFGLFASNHWYQSQVQEEINEIDTEVLTGDLPIDAYLDRGFDAWLKRSSD